MEIASLDRRVTALETEGTKRGAAPLRPLCRPRERLLNHRAAQRSLNSVPLGPLVGELCRVLVGPHLERAVDVYEPGAVAGSIRERRNRRGP